MSTVQLRFIRLLTPIEMTTLLFIISSEIEGDFVPLTGDTINYPISSNTDIQKMIIKIRSAISIMTLPKLRQYGVAVIL